MTIVRTTYRYKRPPRKRKAVAIDVPAIVRKRGRADVVVSSDRVGEPASANDDRRPTIVTARKPGRCAVPDVPDMTPEEHKRRGDAADALFREMKRAIADKLREE